MIKFDVSEIKTFKTCTRQWQLSSRNKFHLRPTVTPPQFAMGTIFHEALAQMYLGVNYDKIMEMVRREMQKDTDAALLAMIPGYYKNVLPDDLDRFQVLDVEHHFEIEPTLSSGRPMFLRKPKVDENTGLHEYDTHGNTIEEPGLVICGSIDMIALDKDNNAIYGFEHKTCKSFRDPQYTWMDEQPRVYTWALKEYIKTYNAKKLAEWEAAGDKDVPKPTPATLGGVYLNEVKKLLRQFQSNRTLCIYTDEDLDNFMWSFFSTCSECKHMIENDSYAAPKPSYFGCQMCSFKSICATYMYNNIHEDEILKEFEGEFTKRTEDHLDEKVERSTAD